MVNIGLTPWIDFVVFFPPLHINHRNPSISHSSGLFLAGLSVYNTSVEQAPTFPQRTAPLPFSFKPFSFLFKVAGRPSFLIPFSSFSFLLSSIFFKFLNEGNHALHDYCLRSRGLCLFGLRPHGDDQT